ncbi:MAG: hypothetical protein HC784_14110 [Hydrococcus sp. CSU_1_8]|nr:hypothetical protein [Hydrococcus sp. CSU_1_8]
MRAISNNINTEFLTALDFSQNVNNRTEGLIGEQTALNDIEKKATECKATANITAAKSCLQDLDNLVSIKRSDGSIRDTNVLDKLTNYSSNLATALTSGSTLDKLLTVVNPVTDAVGQIVLAPWMAIVFFLLQGVTAAVQAMAEASFMMTALVTPVFLVGGLLPNGSKSIIAILTAFWSIINYKLCYIIIVGLSAQISADNNGTTALQLSLITAILAPILAGILAAGAGMGFAQAAASVAGQIAGSAASIAVSAATGGGSSIAGALGSLIGKK